MRHPELFVNFEQQNRYYPCLPVVTMDYVWMPVCLQHELKCRLAEKGEPFRVIMMPIIDAPAENISPRMGFDKEALPIVNKTEEDGAMDQLVVKRDPEIVVDFPQFVNLLIPHAVVLRKN